MNKLEKLLYLTGLAYILRDTYDTYGLNHEEATKVSKLTAEEFRVDYHNVTKEDSNRIRDYLTIELNNLKKELLVEEENN